MDETELLGVGNHRWIRLQESTGAGNQPAGCRQLARWHGQFREIAAALPGLAFPLVRRSRIVAGEPFFRMREIEGPANSETRIEPIARGPDYWRYALTPLTGRKHQLRVHMAALGAPILDDPFYPHARAEAADDYTRPLRLLARSLDFRDPLDGRPRRFESTRTL